MKLLFCSDLHIKLGQKNVPVEWARNRFNLFLEQFGEMQNDANRVVLGGDIFDRIPTVDEMELYFDLVASMTKPTIIYSGNHEALKKDTTFLTYLKKSTNRINSLVEIIDNHYSDDEIDIIPYNRLKTFEKQGFANYNKILCTHVRGAIPPHVKPEIDLDLFKQWDLVLAGDLHSHENSQLNIVYPGSPYTTSFHRNPITTGAIIADCDSLGTDFRPFNLPQLIKRTVTAADDLSATTFHHTIYEIEGDLRELGSILDNELIDKKVVKRSQDTQLVLDPELTLAEEVREYLLYILELPEDTVNEVLEEFYSLADKIE